MESQFQLKIKGKRRLVNTSWPGRGQKQSVKSPKNNNITTYKISLTRRARPKKKNNRAMHTIKRTYNLKIIYILTINMASHTHGGASCGINRNHLGYVHKFCILNNDKTALNTSLDNVYCWAKIQIAYKYIYHGFSNSKRCYNCE